jgi:hypothetical protein
MSPNRSPTLSLRDTLWQTRTLPEIRLPPPAAPTTQNARQSECRGRVHHHHGWVVGAHPGARRYL